jgi:glycosyltransferase involved in cell wall biosynthesis
VGNSPLAWLPRLRGARTFLNVDGEDWAREKWTGFARWYQRQCERVAARAANVVIADARVVQQRYRERYGCDAVFAPYGGDRARDERTEALQRWGLTPQGYYLYVGRLVPENAVDLLLRAFANVRSPRRLVIVGDAPYVDAYKASLRRLGARDPRVVFTGYAFGADYAQLSSHCYVYLQPSAVQGTRPALLDQLGFGNCVLVRGSSANLEVVADAGYAFDHGAPEAGLAAALQRLDADPEAVARGRRKGQARVSGYYQWEWVTSFYEDLFQRVLQGEPLRSYDEWLASGPLRADAAVSTP